MVKKRGGGAGRMDREVTKAVPLRKATPWDGGPQCIHLAYLLYRGGKEIERARGLFWPRLKCGVAACSAMELAAT